MTDRQLITISSAHDEKTISVFFQSKKNFDSSEADGMLDTIRRVLIPPPNTLTSSEVVSRLTSLASKIKASENSQIDGVVIYFTFYHT